MNVSLVSVSPDAEKHMAYCARVSNPNNQDNENYAGLLRYCIKHQHWSIFEQAFMTLEINTTRGLAAQILRHRSFTFQEFSQRYADTNLLDANIPLPDLRRQDTKNRQNSIDDIPEKQTKFDLSSPSLHCVTHSPEYTVFSTFSKSFLSRKFLISFISPQVPLRPWGTAL